MAMGGGTWLVQNKVLPGTYINFVSLARAIVSMADRGYVAIPLELDWGVDDGVMVVENSDFQKSSSKYFGYSFEHKKLKGLRDLFTYAKTAYIYKLNKGTKAENKYATARYTGIRGNDIKIVVANNVDKSSMFDVKTLVDGQKVAMETVSNVTELKGNEWVEFKKDSSLEATTGLALSGGTNGTVNGSNYQSALDEFEKYYFNILGCLSTEKNIKDLFIAYTKRMREEVGAKFQTVLYRLETADYEGVISVQNKVISDGDNEASMVYWVSGVQAGCPVNESVTNRRYTGDFEMEFLENQTGLINGVNSGKFLFHKVGGEEVRVLTDINTFTSITVDKNGDFSSNQTIRVLDQVATDIARLFNKSYVGKVPNDNAGRISLWNDIVAHHKELMRIRAIENFDEKDVIVEKGNDKKSVLVSDTIIPVNAMEKLYMTVIVG